MLTTFEKIIFILAALASAYAAFVVIGRITKIIARGHGKPDWSIIPSRFISVLAKTGALLPVWRTRPVASFFHAMVAWGFLFYLLVNVVDLLKGFIPNFHFLGNGWLGNTYRLLADLFSLSVLVGMSALLIRRFAFKDPELMTRGKTLLDPKAKYGKSRDSLLVGLFVIFHVGGRLLGEISHIAVNGADPWQPFSNQVAVLFNNWSESVLNAGIHIGFWLAIGLIMLFLPYFLYSKHLHLFMAPLNFLLAPERRSPGELDPLDFEDESIEAFGATYLEDLSWTQIMDAFACIMCNRCQEVCPAYTTEKALSPAALEINKRYFINAEGVQLAKGNQSSLPLLEFAITEEAVFACTACGACTDICPVGNDPLRDIMDIRRALVLMENNFPEQWQFAFRGMERTSNPWGIPPAERMKWAEGLNVPTITQNPRADLLWWVGCAPATDASAQKSAQAFAHILDCTDMNYAVLGPLEQCTGDSARRSGNEYLFYELATANVAILNEVAPKRIVTTCPHCLHTLSNEYPAFGGNYKVVHHTQLISELIKTGKLQLQQYPQEVTFHDPCYLGRQNGILDEPRNILKQTGCSIIEMVKFGQQSFCCGAGGAQMWKEEEEGQERVSVNRYRQSEKTGANILTLGCPFCMIMLRDAASTKNSQLQIKDLAEIVLERLAHSS